MLGAGVEIKINDICSHVVHSLATRKSPLPCCPRLHRPYGLQRMTAEG